MGLWVDRESPGYWPGETLAQDPVKVGAIGVRISRWVTMHGFALNLVPELALFRSIVPCGISRYEVGSVQSLSGAVPVVRATAERALLHLADVLGASAGSLTDGEPRERVDSPRAEVD